MEFDFTKLIPRFIVKDRSGYALAKAIEVALKYVDSVVNAGLEVLQNTDTMPEWRLDELAWEYGASWYDYDADVETKRSQIEGVQAFYDRLGTPYAVISALNAVYGNGEIEEWPAYSGTAFHYRVYVTDESAAQEYREKLMKLLAIVQNVRSVLDDIIYYGAQGKATEYIMTAVSGIDGRVTAKAE